MVIEEGTTAGIGGVHVELNTIGIREHLNVYTETAERAACRHQTSGLEHGSGDALRRC